MSFFVSTLSLLLFLSLTFAACGRSTVDSSVATPPSLARDPVNQVYALAWSPNGTDLATGGKNGLIQVWNTKSKTRLVTVKQHFGEVHALAWSPAGTRLASGGQDFTVHLWNPTTGQQVAVYRSTFSTGEVLAVAWSPDGKHIASASQDQTVQVWDAMTGKRFLTYRGHAAEVWDVSWSTDGKHIVSAGNGGCAGYLAHPFEKPVVF